MKTPRHRVHQGPRVLATPPDVVVVGAGPAGLSAATELRRRDVESVLVIERVAQAGGVPRLCDHTGFGLQDLHRSLSGPRYAARLVDESLRAGIELWLSTTVTDVSSDGAVTVSGPNGIAVLHPRSVVLATGVRERPRSARLVPGDRPAGVLTTGQLQALVAAEQPLVGTRALVVGAEHVSYSAVLTLRHAGIEVVAMTTELEAHQSVALGAWVMCGAVAEVLDRVRAGRTSPDESLRRLKGLPRGAWGTTLAHFALGVFLIGACLEPSWKTENAQVLAPGQSLTVAGYQVKLNKVDTVDGPNFAAERAQIEATKGGRPACTGQPEKRVFPDAGGQSTSHVMICMQGLSDLYVVLGDARPLPGGQGGWLVTAHWNPWARLIWLGPFLMALGGLISLSDRRLRYAVPKAARVNVGLAPEPAE